MRTKADILKEIKAFGFPGKEVAISMDDFFGSDKSSSASIGVNVYPVPPSPEKFHQIFKDLVSSKKADRIFVRISDADDPEEWFYTDTVYVIGNLSLEELQASIEVLEPDEIFEEWMYGKPVNVEDIKGEQKVYSIWWD